MFDWPAGIVTDLVMTRRNLDAEREAARVRMVAEDCGRRRTVMANFSRWEDIKNRNGAPSAATRAGVVQDLDLGQLIYDLRTETGLSQRELAERMGTTQSVISRLEEGGGAKNRIDILARVAKALDRHLVLSFPTEVPDTLTDAVQVA